MSKQDDLIAWAKARGFVPSSEGSTDFWELAYAHTIGWYGYITIRVSGTGWCGYDLIVLSGHGPDERGISLGVCRTLDQLTDLVDRLVALDYDRGEYRELLEAQMGGSR